MAKKITLEQFLAYVDDEQEIQVCFMSVLPYTDISLEDYVSLSTTSKMIIPFLNCEVEYIGIEEPLCGTCPVFRISISERKEIQNE